MHSLHQADGLRAKGVDGVLMPFNLALDASATFNEKMSTLFSVSIFPVSLQLTISHILQKYRANYTDICVDRIEYSIM